MDILHRFKSRESLEIVLILGCITASSRGHLRFLYLLHSCSIFCFPQQSHDDVEQHRTEAAALLIPVETGVLFSFANLLGIQFIDDRHNAWLCFPAAW